MKRKFISLEKLEIYDAMHQKSGDSFIVDAEKDGQTTEDHKKGIEYIKAIILQGQKVLPPLVAEIMEGEYVRLDGFKRCMAFKELGFTMIEAFVCDRFEYDHADYIPFRNGKMRCWKGGQFDDLNGRRFPLLEGNEKKEFKYEDLHFLYKSSSGSGLRIELCEAVHIHWGEVGKNRLILGRTDFIKLAQAISKI